MVPSIKSHPGTHHSPSARGHRVTAQKSLGIHLCVCVSGLLGARITSSNSGFHTNPNATEEDRTAKEGMQLRRRAGGTEYTP